jgi:hypothetical protein
LFVVFAAVGVAAPPRLRRFPGAGRTELAVLVLARASPIVLIENMQRAGIPGKR